MDSKSVTSFHQVLAVMSHDINNLVCNVCLVGKASEARVMNYVWQAYVDSVILIYVYVLVILFLVPRTIFHYHKLGRTPLDEKNTSSQQVNKNGHIQG